MLLPYREVKFQLIPNGLYYFDTTYREKSVLILNTVSENGEGLHGGSTRGNKKCGERCTCWGYR